MTTPTPEDLPHAPWGVSAAYLYVLDLDDPALAVLPELAAGARAGEGIARRPGDARGGLRDDLPGSMPMGLRLGSAGEITRW